MPTEVEPAGAPPATRVTISAPLELQFCLFIIERAVTSSAAKWTQAWLPDFMRDHRELADAVAAFWADGAPSEWGELTVYADAAGVLFLDDVATALPRVEAVAARGLVVPPLPAEEPHVQPLIQARVESPRHFSRRPRTLLRTASRRLGSARTFVAEVGPGSRPRARRSASPAGAKARRPSSHPPAEPLRASRRRLRYRRLRRHRPR